MALATARYTLGFGSHLRWRWMRTAVLGSILAAGLAPGPVRAESLIDVLASTYRYNPQLDSERARLRATDEDVNQAYAGFRPTIDLSADAGRQRSDVRPLSGAAGTTNPKGYAVQLVQPLFRGFQTINAVNEAEAGVRAGRETLRNVEQDVLLTAVTAYGNVVRDQAVVRLRENNVNVLTSELKATQDRFAVGEVTRTDVAQAQARRALAVSDLDLAKANLKSSRAVFEQTVGHPPVKLVEPAGEPKLVPRTLEEAVGISVKENPNVVAALYREQGARYTVERIRGELLPEAQLEATYSDRFESSVVTDEVETTSVVGRVNVPIYEGGSVYSRVRQAKHIHVSLIQEIEQARAAVQSNVVQAWSLLVAARAQLTSDKAQIDANRIALAGVREEEKVGQRTILDVLNAQQELLNSEVEIESTKRNLLVSAYSVIAAIGRLNVAEVGATSTVYDPEAHYKESVGKWFGLDITHDDGTSEHLELAPATDHAPIK